MSRDRESLIDIEDSIELIFQYTANVSEAELDTNLEKQDAVLRRFIIIGEATKRLSPEFRLQNSTIPWKKIAGMRDIVTHNYDKVDLDEVWKIIRNDLPKLLEDIKPLI